MAIVNSKTQRLTLPEIIGHALGVYGLKGMEFTKAVLLTMKEMEIEGCETVNVGNTVFITHYTPDRRTALLKVLNADTHTNMLGNIEMFLKHALSEGTDLFMCPHENAAQAEAFKNLEKNNVATVDTRKNENGALVSVINLAPGKEEPSNA